MDTRPPLLDAAPAPAVGDRGFVYLLTAYLVPRGLFLDPEAQGAWSRWARRRHNLGMLRKHALTFARRWGVLWILGSGTGKLVGGASGDLLMLVAGLAIVPAVVFVCTRLAADIAGDDLPL